MGKFKILFAGLAGLAIGQWASAQTVSTKADFAVIMDHESGEILFSKNGDEAMIPASMTKIMTSHLVFDRLKSGEIELHDRFTVSENAWRKGGWATGGSTMGLSPGETPTVDELLRGVIVLSGNDACIVLAEGLSGSEEAFAVEMTELAQDMGLTSASFKNASGLLADGHMISAKDLAMLAQRTIEDHPEFYQYYSTEKMTWNNISQTNRNPLLGKMGGVDGLKTGHLSASGYGLTASAQKGKTRRIIVLNGLESSKERANEAERLMRMAFSAFDTREVTATGSMIAELPVWLGEQRTVGAALVESFTVTAHKRAFPNGSSKIVYNSPLEAPVTAGDHIADLVIEIDGKEDITVPLVATTSVGKLDFIGRATEGLSYMIGGDQ